MGSVMLGFDGAPSARAALEDPFKSAILVSIPHKLLRISEVLVL